LCMRNSKQTKNAISIFLACILAKKIEVFSLFNCWPEAFS